MPTLKVEIMQCAMSSLFGTFTHEQVQRSSCSASETVRRSSAYAYLHAWEDFVRLSSTAWFSHKVCFYSHSAVFDSHLRELCVCVRVCVWRDHLRRAAFVFFSLCRFRFASFPRSLRWAFAPFFVAPLTWLHGRTETPTKYPRCDRLRLAAAHQREREGGESPRTPEEKGKEKRGAGGHEAAHTSEEPAAAREEGEL